jgi:hypothetical protein
MNNTTHDKLVSAAPLGEDVICHGSDIGRQLLLVAAACICERDCVLLFGQHEVTLSIDCRFQNYDLFIVVDASVCVWAQSNKDATR